ncbi:hypothetical protein NFI96_002933 [Prochilodus magdalenae]|nr:hypothetical protein NFI96_002933 [Prochilodus magdalenae]
MVAHSAVEDTSGTADRRAPRSRPHQHTETQTHFRSFRNESDFSIINKTTSMLEESGFYWGPMTVEEAHQKLKKEPVGTFLIRDSQQKDVFFTLSYRASSGPASIRITFQNSKFCLAGSKECFDSLFKLLEYYTSSSKRSLVRPYRKERVQSLQQLCRKRIIETCGSGEAAVDSVPVNPILKDFLRSFPYQLTAGPRRRSRTFVYLAVCAITITSAYEGNRAAFSVHHSRAAPACSAHLVFTQLRQLKRSEQTLYRT